VTKSIFLDHADEWVWDDKYGWQYDGIECPLCGGCLIERDHSMSMCQGPTVPLHLVNTSGQVAPAPGGEQNVEQQTKEDGTQLSEKDVR
jgi:hypothetical protein